MSTCFWGAENVGYTDLDRFVLPNSVYPNVGGISYSYDYTASGRYILIWVVYTDLGAVYTALGGLYRFQTGSYRPDQYIPPIGGMYRSWRYIPTLGQYVPP